MNWRAAFLSTLAVLAALFVVYVGVRWPEWLALAMASGAAALFWLMTYQILSDDE